MGIKVICCSLHGSIVYRQPSIHFALCRSLWIRAPHKSLELNRLSFGYVMREEEAYARATVALTRVRKMCVIFCPLDMKGLIGATAMGSLMYGAGHCWYGTINVHLRGSSPEDCPGDNQFISSLDLTDVPGGTMAQNVSLTSLTLSWWTSSMVSRSWSSLEWPQVLTRWWLRRQQIPLLDMVVSFIWSVPQASWLSTAQGGEPCCTVAVCSSLNTLTCRTPMSLWKLGMNGLIYWGWPFEQCMCIILSSCSLFPRRRCALWSWSFPRTWPLAL